MTKLVFKTKPRPYQIPALKKLLRSDHPGGGLWVPMRWGKTWVGINAAAALNLKYAYYRVLVVTTVDGIGVWEDEFEKHCPIPYRLFDKHGELVGGSQYGASYEAPMVLHVQIVNYEWIYDRERQYDKKGKYEGWDAVTRKQLHKFEPQIIIVDESHHIGNPSPIISRKLYHLAKKAPVKIFMTGTPWHRKPFYVFGQFKIYDDSIFGTNFGQFKKMIAVFGGYGGYEVKSYQNLKWLRDKVKPHVFISKKIPSAPPVVRKIKFSLAESRDTYDKMASESFVSIDGNAITAPIVLTRHLRLAQIAGGWTTDEEGVRHCVGQDRRKAFRRRLAEFDQAGIQKIVVGCRFIPELKDCALEAKAAGYSIYLLHGGVSRVERKARREAFRTDTKAVMVCQFRASREAVDMSTADTMVFYSLPEDYLTYDQFKARIAKYGETRTLLYEHLIAKGTVDETTFEALMLGRDVADHLMKNPSYVEERSVKL